MDRVSSGTTTTTVVINNPSRAGGTMTTAQGHVIPGADAGRRGNYYGDRSVQVVQVQQQTMPFVPVRGGGGVNLGNTSLAQRNVQARNDQVPLAQQNAINRLHR